MLVWKSFRYCNITIYYCYRLVIFRKSHIITCSRDRNIQNIQIRILQILFFCLIKSRANRSGITQPFLNPNLIFFFNGPQIVCCRIIRKNQNKNLENSNLNILEVPMFRTSYKTCFIQFLWVFRSKCWFKGQ